MKNRLIVFAVVGVCVSIALGLFFFRHAEKDVYPKLLASRGGEEEENEGMAARQDGMKKAMEQEFLMTRDPSLNRIPVERLETARKQAEKMKLGAGLRDAFTQGLGWQERGPNNIGGRVRAILIDRSDATSNTVIVGSVSGGLWRTTNFQAATPTWTPINDFLNNLAICALAQDPRPGFQNIMYAGTGEGYYNLDNVRGAGIFKSTDNGLTWSLLSATHQPTTYNFDYVQRLLVDNSGNIYAACRSYYCNLGGIMKSSDGGVNWTRVIGTSGGTCAASSDLEGADLELASNNDVYATVGLFTTGRIYKSSYAANGAATGNAGTWTNITPSGTYYRIELAVAPSNSNRLYGLFEGTNNDVIDIRRSSDGGTTWTASGALPVPTVYNQGANSVFSNGQAWYDLNLAVDPLHPDTLVIGGLDLLRSYNAAANWTQISNWTGAGGSFTANQYAHADQHIMVYDPANDANAIFGNDGGIFYSTNANASGLPTFTAKNTGFNVTQYYAAALHPTTTNYILAGAQDNGSHVLTSAGMNAATTVAGGDGAFCHIDQVDGKIQIAAYVYNSYAFSVNGGTTFSGFYQLTSNYSRFINPTGYDNTNKLLYTCDSIGRYGIVSNINNAALNIAPTYTKVSMSSVFGPRQVSAIKVDPNTANRVWFGVSDNALPIVVKVDNANTITPTSVSYSLPGISTYAYISSVDVENGNANHILVTLSNYGVVSVFETTDGGTTWVSLDNNGVNLPDMPIRWGVFVPSGYNPGQRVAVGTGGILLGTELGVWSCSVSNGTSTTWSANNTGLANVRVDMVAIRSSDKMVVAATHGRGIFTTTLPAGALPVTFRSFSGKDELRYNRLVWQVENEQTNRGFELERKYPGEAFNSLGFVTGKNVAGRNNYSFNDMLIDLGQQAAEYRLKQVDMSGRVSYSPVIVVTRKPSERFIEYVSSGGNDLFIRINKGSRHQQLTLQFLDTKGSLLRKQTIGSHSQHVDIGWLPSGIYVLNITNNRGKSFTQKIWK